MGVQPAVEADVGCCLLFADGLRFDLGQRVGTALELRGLRVTQLKRWSALPSVTATAKPAVSPAAERVRGAGLPDTFKPNNDAGQALETARLRKLIEEEGYQCIDAGETGRAGEPGVDTRHLQRPARASQQCSGGLQLFCSKPIPIARYPVAACSTCAAGRMTIVHEVDDAHVVLAGMLAARILPQRPFHEIGMASTSVSSGG